MNDGFEFFIAASKNTIQIVKALLCVVVGSRLIDEISSLREYADRVVVERLFPIQHGALQILFLRIGGDGKRVVEKKQSETQNKRQKQKRSRKAKKRDARGEDCRKLVVRIKSAQRIR